VQIASSHTQLDKSSSVFRGLHDVDMYLSGDLYKYTVGKFRQTEEAHNRKRELRAQGFNGAFVAAFKNGSRVPMSSVNTEN
jgi:hypothetical protein